MDEIPIVQRKRCKCGDGEGCKCSKPAHPGELVVTWDGREAERVKAAAVLLGIEPEALVRGAVDDRLKESTFTPADEQAHRVIEDAREGHSRLSRGRSEVSS